MKFTNFLHATVFIALTMSAFGSWAEDTDIFNQPVASNQAPNVLFILDNTSNWGNQAQFSGGVSQGEAEMQAISDAINSFKSPVNIGLMMFTNAGITGSYLRYGIRPITNSATNKTALTSLLADIKANINSPSNKVNKSNTPAVNSLYETWLYLNGSNSFAGMDASADYIGNTAPQTTSTYNLLTGFAYRSSATNAQYNSPLGAACAKTYIIYVGNNNPATKLGTGDAKAIKVLTDNSYPTSFPEASWAKFLHLRPDLLRGSSAASAASVTTFTLDVYGSNGQAQYTSVLQDMAKNGGGQYFLVQSQAAINSALSNIFGQIQAVNSTFASASLPISINVRGTNSNQVYLGMFRPDANAKPNWTGNLKEYQLAVDSTTTPPSLYLADSSNPVQRVENVVTGFINPAVQSFWTHISTFWDAILYGTSPGGVSDEKDGDLVEKGGAAQKIRDANMTTVNGTSTLPARSVYTCTGTCAANSLLSQTPFSTANTTALNDTTLGTLPGTSPDLINWVRGANTAGDDSIAPTPNTTNIRSFAHGDVVHSRPAVINYGPSTAGGPDNIYVFYGANDGMLHAIKGGTDPTTGGTEQWTFIAQEHFQFFKRLRDHSPLITTATTKPYFIDGPTTSYTEKDATGAITKAYLFVTMRRGGRFIYAIDVLDPTNPKLLWKRSTADFTELGSTWSELTVTKLRYQSAPVVIFGLGYDATTNDVVPPAVQPASARGRGVMVLNAADGTKIWQAGPADGMTYSVPANIATFSYTTIGITDVLYAVDTGANVWRIDVSNKLTSKWTVTKLASLGGTGANARKFLFAADVVSAAPGSQYDSVLVGSGDREQPFDTTIANRFYMIKDAQRFTGVAATPIVEGAVGDLTGVAGKLYDTTLNYVQAGTAAQKTAAATALANASGWFITLGTGEKVVSGSTTLAGSAIFGTNTPQAVATNSCTANLGEARLYILDYLTAGATVDVNQNGTIQTIDRYEVRPGGGFPPTPVPVSVKINDKFYQAAISGTKLITPPSPAIGRRYRTYWQRLIDK